MADVTFKDNSGRFLREVKAAIERSQKEIGLQAEGNAKIEIENNPRRVDTGNLRNSIDYAVIGDDVYIGTPVEYGIYVHEGTSRMTPNRFLRNAVTKHANDYRDIVLKNLKRS